jgi:hypothetical protein
LQTLLAKRNQPLDKSHVKFHREQGDSSALHCFVLDCSGSMLSGKRLALAKGRTASVPRLRWSALVVRRRKCDANPGLRIGGTIAGLHP